MYRSALVKYLRALEGVWEHVRYPSIERTGAACAAGDIDDGKRGVETQMMESACRIASRQAAAYGIPGHHDVAVNLTGRRFGLRMGDRKDAGEASIDPCCQSKNRRLLVRQNRGDARRGDHRGYADEAARAENNVRPE